MQVTKNCWVSFTDPLYAVSMSVYHSDSKLYGFLRVPGDYLRVSVSSKLLTYCDSFVLFTGWGKVVKHPRVFIEIKTVGTK